jgi:hypothetical protein
VAADSALAALAWVNLSNWLNAGVDLRQTLAMPSGSGAQLR